MLKVLLVVGGETNGYVIDFDMVVSTTELYVVGESSQWMVVDSGSSATTRHPFTATLDNDVFMSGGELMNIAKWTAANNTWVTVKDLGFWRKDNNNLASSVKVDDDLLQWCS